MGEETVHRGAIRRKGVSDFICIRDYESFGGVVVIHFYECNMTM